jgi:hypothetical protein
MQFHLGYIFLKMEVAFYKHYHTIQNDEHVYMVFKSLSRAMT